VPWRCPSEWHRGWVYKHLPHRLQEGEGHQKDEDLHEDVPKGGYEDGGVSAAVAAGDGTREEDDGKHRVEL